MPLKESAIIELVSQSCRMLGLLDITHAALGHVSNRIEGRDAMYIKGKGPGEVGLRYTSNEDVLVVDFNADKLEGPDYLQPPSESFLHIWMYKIRPEVQSVVHMHPKKAVLLTICQKPVIPIYNAFGFGARLAVEGIPTYPRSCTISNDELGQEFARAMGDKQVCLMKGHGMTGVGGSVIDSTLNTLALVELTEMMYDAYLLGDPTPILPEEIEAIRSRRSDTTPRARGSAGGDAGRMAAWRYYASLAEERAIRAGLARPRLNEVGPRR